MQWASSQIIILDVIQHSLHKEATGNCDDAQQFGILSWISSAIIILNSAADRSPVEEGCIIQGIWVEKLNSDLLRGILSVL